MSQIVMDRAALIARLEEQAKVARAYDKEQAAKHKLDEQEALRKFRAHCREAVKWDYKTLKANTGSWGRIYLTAEFPMCPVSVSNRYVQAIASVKLSQQQRYTISSTGVHGGLYELITWDPNPPAKDVCS